MHPSTNRYSRIIIDLIGLSRQFKPLINDSMLHRNLNAAQHERDIQYILTEIIKTCMSNLTMDNLQVYLTKLNISLNTDGLFHDRIANYELFSRAYYGIGLELLEIIKYQLQIPEFDYREFMCESVHPTYMIIVQLHRGEDRQLPDYLETT